MNSRRPFIFAALLILAVFLWIFWPTSKPVQPIATSSQKPAAQAQLVVSLPAKTDAQGRLLPVDPNATHEPSRQPDQRTVKSITEAYLTPISFYGKVVDESGAPIAGASVKLMANDKPFGNSSVYSKTSDVQGMFSLHGARGVALSINVWKQGYYSTAASQGRFVYGGVRGGDEPKNPSPGNPAIFVLKKMGETVPLVHLPRKSIKVPKDGTPVEIDLTTGRIVAVGMGHLRVEVSTANHGRDPNNSQPYDWEARVSIPGGGLVERAGEYAFEAPENGYAPTFATGMQKNATRWRDGFQKEYFAKLGNGQFARFYLRLLTGGDHFIVLESYLNPTPGSRNLEFDPKQTENAAKP